MTDSKDQWDAFVQQHLENVRKHAIDSPSEGCMNCTLLLSCDPQSGELWAPPRQVALLGLIEGDSPEEVNNAKSAFEICMRAIAVAGNAVAGIWSSEVWMSQNTSSPPVDDPDRSEAVLVVTDHHQFGSNIFSASINQQNQDRTIGPWIPVERAKGRFLSLVPPDHIVSDVKTVASARAFIAKHKDTIRIVELP